MGSVFILFVIYLNVLVVGRYHEHKLAYHFVTIDLRLRLNS